jgi:hypothetical protein
MDRAALIVLVAGIATYAGCGGGSDSAPGRRSAFELPESIAVLGDSVAAGEGIDYGYAYSTTIPNRWTGGADDPTWERPYQLCHQSILAYGDPVASSAIRSQAGAT